MIYLLQGRMTNNCLLNDPFLMESELENGDEVIQKKEMTEDGAGNLNGNLIETKSFQVSMLPFINQI